MYSQEPDNKKIKNVWKNQGVFDFVKYLDSGKIEYDEKVKPYKIENFKGRFS